MYSAISPSCRPFGIIVYLLYLFFVVVVLLSLLIAQMSDTFANIQSDADRVSIWIRAKTVLTQERNGMFGIVSKLVCVSCMCTMVALLPFCQNFRRRFFIREEIWKNPSSKMQLKLCTKKSFRIKKFPQYLPERCA